MILLIIGCVVYVWLVYFKKENQKQKKQEDIIEGYNYKLYDTDTDNYKKLFYELKDILSSSTVSEEEYVKVISKMFVMDFYTLENKTSNDDIGGTDFVYSKVLDNFKAKAKDTVYLYLETALQENKDLPVVDDVIVEDVNTTKYTYLDTSDEKCYEVDVTIEYEKDLGYDTEKTLYFVHEGNKLSLVEIA